MSKSQGADHGAIAAGGKAVRRGWNFASAQAHGCRRNARRPDSQLELAQRLGLKYYTFISQIENGFGRVPSDSMEGWARALGIPPADFARQLVVFTSRSFDKPLSR